MMKDVVSIMIPCFNGEVFLDRLFHVILNQTYKKIQVVFVDDGSYDLTRDMVESYDSRFVREGMEIKYFYQKNQGQAAAINLALTHVTGEYCMWFDVDDLMTPDHVEKKVSFLEEHPDCDLAMCTGYVYHEKDMLTPMGTLGEEKAVTSFFEDILFERRRCTPGLYMVRTSALMEALSDKHIYDTNRRMGVGMQMLLPIALQDHIGYIEDKLFHYIIREDSHSHSMGKNTANLIKYLENGQDTKRHVLDELMISEAYRNFLKQRVNLFVCISKINLINQEIEIRMPEYVKNTVLEYLCWANVEKNRNDRKLMIWGKCRYTEKIAYYLGKYADIQVTAYIESDQKKCDGEKVLYKESISKGNMYLVIPLGYHDDIVRLLQERGFESSKDFFYPEYELRKSFQGKKTIEKEISLNDRIIYQYPIVLKYLKNKVNGWNICDFFERYGYQNVVLYAVTELMDLVLDDTACSRNSCEIILCDRNAEKYARGHKDHQVIDVDMLLRKYQSKSVDCIMVCSLFHENEIIIDLMKKGIPQDKIISIVSAIFSEE